MKKLLSLVLVLTLCFTLFAGCSDKPENTKEQKDAVVISPLPQTIDINNLDNCTVAVSLEKGDAYVDDSGKMQMDLKVFTYDLYDMVDIANLAEGNVFVINGEEVEVTSVERLDTGLIYVNGGQEKGGFDLISYDDTVYHETGMNDAKSYYEIGSVTLPVSTEFVFVDESDLENGKSEYYPGDFLAEEELFVYDFNPQNTNVVIEDGVIIQMNKYYMP